MKTLWRKKKRTNLLWVAEWMRGFVFLCLFCSSVFASRCSSRTKGISEVRRFFVIPPQKRSGDYLKKFPRCEKERCFLVAWAKLHYLLDLFDFARLKPDSNARKLLLDTLEAWGGDPIVVPREETSKKANRKREIDGTTAKVLSRLEKLVSQSLKRIKKNRGIKNQRLVYRLHDLRKILRWDRNFFKTPDERLEQAAFLKKLARSFSPLRVNALLRLYGWCEQSLYNAMIAPEGSRQRSVNFCLYTLGEHDPRAYVTQRAHRLPAPDPLVLHSMNLRFLDKIEMETDNRLARELVPVLKKRRDIFAGVLAEKTRLWSRPLKKGAGAQKPLFTVDDASPRIEAPLVVVTDEEIRAGHKVLTEPSKKLLRPLMTWLYNHGDRHHLVFRVSPSVNWFHVWPVVRAAVRSGFESMGFQVLVRYREELSDEKEQRVAPPPLESSVLLERQRGVRLGELDLSLTVIAPWATKRNIEKISPVKWSNHCISKWLTVSISSDALRLTSKGGVCSAQIPLSENKTGLGPFSLLQDKLLDFKKAHPDECGLLVAVSERTPFHVLAKVLSAVRKTTKGQELFQTVALRINPGRCDEGKLFPSGLPKQPHEEE